jgi:hypothetical protein
MPKADRTGRFSVGPLLMVAAAPLCGENVQVSIKVAVDDLGPVVDSYGWGYLLTTGDRPHVEAQPITFEGGALRIIGIGQTSMANLSRKPRVTILFPPGAALAAFDGVPEGFTLIVDGEAAITARAKRTAIAIHPTSAVFHRPAPSSDD